MELNSLLNTLVQGSETTALAQIEPKAPNPNGAVPAQPGLALPVTGANLSGLGGNLPGTGGGLTGPGGALTPGGPADLARLGIPPELSLGSGPPGPGSNMAGLPGPASFSLTVRAQSGPGSSAQPTPGALVPLSPGPGALAVTSAATQLANAQALRAGFATASGAGTEDVYHGSGAPAASASLLSQSGVGAYIHLLSTLASSESDQKSATLLTNNLGNASATLRASYTTAFAALPPQLQQKDWSFSVANGVLVFTAGKDALSHQDLAELQRTFASANVAAPAREVAAAIASIQVERRSGADSGALGWGALGADDGNGDGGVNLRSYVTGSVPGGHYQPAAQPPVADPGSHPEIPALLGGMDLRHLETARPNFLRADGSVAPAPKDEDQDQDEPLADATEPHASTVRGQCSCGEIQLLVENNFEYAFYCHCSRCRARTGSAFAAIGGISTEKVQVIAGNDHLLLEGECAEGYGARCSRCYAFLFAAVRERRYLHISLGVLSDSPNRLPDHHIHVASKAPWFKITDDLPQYDEMPDA